MTRVRLWMRTAPSALVGGLLGYLAVRLSGLFGIAFTGVALALVVGVPLLARYLRAGEGMHAGALLLWAGAVPAVLLGRTWLTSLVDPAVGFRPDDMPWLIAAVAVALTGLALTLMAPSSRSRQ